MENSHDSPHLKNRCSEKLLFSHMQVLILDCGTASPLMSRAWEGPYQGHMFQGPSLPREGGDFQASTHPTPQRPQGATLAQLLRPNLIVICQMISFFLIYLFILIGG